ncbi:hypothetical protein N5M11_000226 [Vibrio alginolyticus]|uniref:hypothetical protein n=1 Tax=Vibrio alginolyticus TaxID=663 RepID=UPI00186A7B9F|nr:hypothetical protein [Vibrio alginolyticus]
MSVLYLVSTPLESLQRVIPIASVLQMVSACPVAVSKHIAASNKRFMVMSQR